MLLRGNCRQENRLGLVHGDSEFFLAESEFAAAATRYDGDRGGYESSSELEPVDTARAAPATRIQRRCSPVASSAELYY